MDKEQMQIQKDLLVLFAKEEVLLSEIQELLRSREDGDELLLSARDSDGGTVLHALARAYLEHCSKNTPRSSWTEKIKFSFGERLAYVMQVIQKVSNKDFLNIQTTIEKETALHISAFIDDDLSGTGFNSMLLYFGADYHRLLDSNKRSACNRIDCRYEPENGMWSTINLMHKEPANKIYRRRQDMLRCYDQEHSRQFVISCTEELDNEQSSSTSSLSVY